MVVTAVEYLLYSRDPLATAAHDTLERKAAALRRAGSFASLEALLAAHDEAPGRLVLFDLDLTSPGGRADLERFLALRPQARVLVFCNHHDCLLFESWLRQGVAGIAVKRDLPELLEAMERVARGGVYLDPQSATRIALRRIHRGTPPFDALSNREYEIFCLAAEGLEPAATAAHLGLTAKTVANHLARIRAKLGCRSAEDFRRLAATVGIVTGTRSR